MMVKAIWAWHACLGPGLSRGGKAYSLINIFSPLGCFAGGLLFRQGRRQGQAGRQGQARQAGTTLTIPSQTFSSLPHRADFCVTGCCRLLCLVSGPGCTAPPFLLIVVCIPPGLGVFVILRLGIQAAPGVVPCQAASCFLLSIPWGGRYRTGDGRRRAPKPCCACLLFPVGQDMVGICVDRQFSGALRLPSPPSPAAWPFPHNPFDLFELLISLLPS